MATDEVVIGFGGVRLRAREWGDPANPAVLLIHGYPDNSNVWSGVVDGLKNSFHVITYDVRGAGKSEPGDRHGGYKFEALLADTIAVIDAFVPAGEHVHLVGHDWGAMQGWAAVCDARLSGRIASYTYFGAPSLDHAGHWLRSRIGMDPRKLIHLADQVRRSWYIAGFHLPVIAPFVWRHGFDRLFPRLFGLTDRVPAELRPVPADLRNDGARGVQLYRANIIPKLLSPNNATTQTPVLAIVADGDPFVSPKIFSETAARVPNLWRRDIRGEHWINRTHSGAVAASIAEFVDFIESGVETPALQQARVN